MVRRGSVLSCAGCRQKVGRLPLSCSFFFSCSFFSQARTLSDCVARIFGSITWSGPVRSRLFFVVVLYECVRVSLGVVMLHLRGEGGAGMLPDCFDKLLLPFLSLLTIMIVMVIRRIVMQFLPVGHAFAIVECSRTVQ